MKDTDIITWQITARQAAYLRRKLHDWSRAKFAASRGVRQPKEWLDHQYDDGVMLEGMSVELKKILDGVR